MTPSPRQQLADEILRRFSAALRSSQLYSAGHPIIARNLEGLTTAVQLLHAQTSSVVIGCTGARRNAGRNANGSLDGASSGPFRSSA